MAVAVSDGNDQEKKILFGTLGFWPKHCTLNNDSYH